MPITIKPLTSGPNYNSVCFYGCVFCYSKLWHFDLNNGDIFNFIKLTSYYVKWKSTVKYQGHISTQKQNKKTEIKMIRNDLES